MTYPYLAWGTWHYMYDSQRSPPEYGERPQIWFATKKTGSWERVLVYSKEYERSYSLGEPMVAVANNGSYFLCTVYWAYPGIITAFESFDEGATWNELDDAGHPYGDRMYYRNGLWVLLDGWGVGTSTDGKSWSWNSCPFICYYNGQYMMDNLGHVHICRQNGSDIEYAVSDDLGQTWAQSTPVSAYGDYWLDAFTAVTAYGQHVIVGGNFESRDYTEHGLYVNFSHDGGLTWEPTDKTQYLLYETDAYESGYYPPGLGFYPESGQTYLYFLTDGWVRYGDDPYRHWAYRCDNWQIEGNGNETHSFTLETIGRGHRGVASSVNPQTGISVFTESFPYFYEESAWATLWHNTLTETDPTTWMSWDIIQQRTPEPLYYMAPWWGSPDHWLLTPYDTYSPPVQFYVTPTRGYAFWW